MASSMTSGIPVISVLLSEEAASSVRASNSSAGPPRGLGTMTAVPKATCSIPIEP